VPGVDERTRTRCAERDVKGSYGIRGKGAS
jgi:hypothetical protein